jgi:hypothetical protein
MKNAALSVRVFGIYLAVTGVTLYWLPNAILPLLGLPEATEIWVRLAGLLTGILGMYFIRAAARGEAGFFRDTITARLIFFTGVVGLVAALGASPLLLAFGAIDLLGAAWTLWALRS